MRIPESQGTLKLTHFGRKSGKAYTVTIWFVDLGGELWIGSVEGTKNWVKNLRDTGKGAIDFGQGEIQVTAEFTDDPVVTARHKAAVNKKYPIMGRLIEGLFGRGKKRVAFRLTKAEL
jgi:deazaflavin-dependent oxidoreductase (nitroreductase family)